jgi:hypothetical protein
MDEQRPMRCPECGDDAIPEPPADPVPWEAHGMSRPEWSHADRTSLCPVIGERGGYQPAQPEPKPTGPAHPATRPEPKPAEARADAQPGTHPQLGRPEPDVHTARLDPPATMRARWQAAVEAAAGTPGRQRAGEHELRLPAGAAGMLGRQYLTRTISRLGELDCQARPGPEPEAGS